MDGRIDRETLQQIINAELLDDEIARVTGLQIYSEADKRWRYFTLTLINSTNGCYISIGTFF